MTGELTACTSRRPRQRRAMMYVGRNSRRAALRRPRMHVVLSFLWATVCGVVPAGAQAVDRLSAQVLDSAARLASRSDARGISFPTSRDNSVQYVLNHRVSPSVIELHCAWDDLFIVRSGVGTLRYSRKLSGLAKYTSWEWRAKQLVAAAEVPMVPGDVIRVPAGEGHEIIPLGDVPLVYLLAKVRTVVPTPCGSLPERGR